MESARTGAPMKVPIRDGCKVAELADAIEQSWKEKRKISLSLEFNIKGWT
jgi:hypothetical protein